MAQGGIIAPDGKPRPPAGPGQLSQRSDLSQPPGQADSDLQYGDRQRLQAAMGQVPSFKQVQGSARPRPVGSSGGAAEPGFVDDLPTDPTELLVRELKGSRTGPRQGGGELESWDPRPWIPLLRAMATAPGSGGLLQAAYVNALSKVIQTPFRERFTYVDLTEIEEAAEQDLFQNG